MFRSGFVACLALVPFVASATAYEIKPKAPESAFSAKLQPDIIGLSSATESSKALPTLEAHLKDLPGVKPETAQQKFGGTGVSYITSIKFALPPTANHPGESLGAWFSSPASGNRAYYISRNLGFATDRQPSKAEVIERVTAKYGDRPTLIGDGRMALILDVDGLRCRRVEENLSRLGLRAAVRAADARCPDDWWDVRPFDRILADVPGSASGVVRASNSILSATWAVEIQILRPCTT